MLAEAPNNDSASVEIGLTVPGEPLSAGDSPIGVAVAHGVSVIIQGANGKKAVLVLTPQEAISLGESIQSAGITAQQSERNA